MHIREQNAISKQPSQNHQENILANIQELEEMLKQGDIEFHAYLTKKRALIKLL